MAAAKQPHPIGDPARLAALRETGLLDHERGSTEAFDRLARLGTRLLAVPVALVTLVDEDRVIFLGSHGLPEPWARRGEVPLSRSFCRHVVGRGEPLVVEDARRGAALRDTGAIEDFGVAAYIGLPLTDPTGAVLGTFCAFDPKPRAWSAEDLASLRDLAATACTEIALRRDLRARARIEAELRESEARYHGIAAANPQVMLYQFLLRPDGSSCLPFVSEGCRALFALDPSELSEDSTPLLAKIVPEDRDAFAATVARSAATLARWHWEGRYAAPDGTVRWAEGSSRPRRLGDGGTLWDGILLDVTGRRHAEAVTRRLAEEQAARTEADLARGRIAALLESITDAFFAVDRQGRFTFVNREAERLLRQPRAALLGAHAAEAFPEAVTPALATGITATLRDGVPLHFEDFYAPLGRWVDVRTYPTPEGAALYMRDSSERKRMERTLRDSEARLRALLENAFDLILVLDARGRCAYVSPSVERMLGYAASALLGSPLVPLVHPDDAPAAAVFAAPADPRGERFASDQLRLRHADGSWRVVEVFALDLLDNPAVAGIVVNARDITDRRAAEEALRDSQAQFLQAQKMEAVGSLAGGIAHDFNNLLTVIKGTVQLLLMDTAADDPIRPDLVEIENTADRAAALTRQLLAFSRRQVMQLQSVALNDVLAELEPMLRRLLEVNIELRIEHGAELGTVRADPSHLEQIVLNLAINARDAMPEGGTLTIRTRNARITESDGRDYLDPEPGPYVVLSVTDTGEGIDPATLPRIFEPFFTTKPKGKGTGLGLATVYGIVKQSGGGIRIESTPGEGSRFEVYLPRTDAASSEAADPSGPGNTSARATVLVTDDEDRVRALAARVLRRAGYHVLEAPNGASALEVLTEHPGHIDLLLTDVVMPGMNGRELADRVVELSPETRCCFMSGYTDDAILRGGVAGTRAFLQKPFTPDALVERVREALEGAPEG